MSAEKRRSGAIAFSPVKASWSGFSTARLSRLVYPQIWEDPEVDLAALSLAPDDRVVTIASGGCNVLTYLTAARPRSSPSISTGRMSR